MAKKIFVFFLIISILVLAGLGGFFYYDSQSNSKEELNVPGISNEENNQDANTNTDADTDADTTEPVYKEDVYSVHLCDGYTDGTFAIRNIKLGMTFRQVINIELKNIGVYVENSAYDKDTFYAMASNENQGKDLLPVKERALLGNACDIVYNFSSDITIEEPEEYPYLESVQFQFANVKDGVDTDKEIEDAFSDCFGKPVLETEGKYSVSTFVGTKDKVQMFYEYVEDNEKYSLKYIIWQKIAE